MYVPKQYGETYVPEHETFPSWRIYHLLLETKYKEASDLFHAKIRYAYYYFSKFDELLMIHMLWHKMSAEAVQWFYQTIDSRDAVRKYEIDGWSAAGFDREATAASRHNPFAVAYNRNIDDYTNNRLGWIATFKSLQKLGLV